MAVQHLYNYPPPRVGFIRRISTSDPASTNKSLIFRTDVKLQSSKKSKNQNSCKPSKFCRKKHIQKDKCQCRMKACSSINKIVINKELTS